MTIYIAITIIIFSAILFGICMYSYNKNFNKKLEEVCRATLEKYFLGIKQCDSVLMWEALNDMFKICPYRGNGCGMYHACYDCTCPVGFADALNYKYGRKVTPNDIKRGILAEDLREILQTRRDFKRDLREGRADRSQDPARGFNLDYGRCGPTGFTSSGAEQTGSFESSD